MSDRLRHDDDDIVRIAHAIAALDIDARMAAVCNGLMSGARGDVGDTIRRLAQTIVTLAAVINDPEMNGIVVQCLHQTADMYEKSRIMLVSSDHAGGLH